MAEEHSTERLSYQSAEREQQAQRGQGEYTPRPKSQVILAWVLLAVVIFAILGSCYWQIFGKF